MSFPAIESERIALRELIESDAMALNEVYSDEQAMRYWDSARHADVSITLATVRGLIESWYIPQGVSWGVVLKDSQELIGQRQGGKDHHAQWRKLCRAYRRPSTRLLSPT